MFLELSVDKFVWIYWFDMRRELISLVSASIHMYLAFPILALFCLFFHHICTVYGTGIPWSYSFATNFAVVESVILSQILVGIWGFFVFSI